MTITAMNRALLPTRSRVATMRGSARWAWRRPGSKCASATRRPRVARRRGRRGSRARADGDAGLLAESRSDPARAGERVAPHRRSSGASTPTGCSRSRTGPRISSSAGDRTSIRAKSRRSCCCTPMSPMSRSSAARTPNGARRSSPASSRAAARPPPRKRAARCCARSTRCASGTSRGSSGRRTTSFVDTLPRNNTGKVLKTELRQQLFRS